MGGELTIEDTPGGGATMVVGLPLAVDAGRSAGMTRVLVVDDEAPIRRAMRANLEARGYDVDLAETRRRGAAARGATPPRRGRCSTSVCRASTGWR